VGVIEHGSGGAQGVSAAPGAILPVTLAGVLPAQATDLTCVASTTSVVLRVDGVLLIPLISRLQLSTAILLTSVDAHPRSHPVTLGSARRANVWAYDRDGSLRTRLSTTTATFAVPVLPGGFTVIYS
jgi:hypothetical protein